MEGNCSLGVHGVVHLAMAVGRTWCTISATVAACANPRRCPLPHAAASHTRSAMAGCRTA